MPSLESLDQPGPDELRWSELASSLASFQTKSVAMADEFSLAIPLLREQGTPLPVNWSRQYVDWCERRNQIAADIAAHAGLPSVIDQSFAEWQKLIETRSEELRAIREQEAAEVRSVAEIVQRVQGLQSMDAQFNMSPEMEQARTLATILLDRLNDPATRQMVMDDAGTMKGMRSILLLIDGTPDSETEEQAVADVEVMFGRKLSIALLRGRVTVPAAGETPAARPGSDSDVDLNQFKIG